VRKGMTAIMTGLSCDGQAEESTRGEKTKKRPVDPKSLTSKLTVNIITGKETDDCRSQPVKP
jgi:hypothetical protein